MNYKFLYNEDTISLPKEKLLGKLGTASETELKVLLYASATATDGIFNENDIQALSGFDLTDIKIALQFWRGAEVIAQSTDSPATASPKATPEKKALLKTETYTYSGEEIAKLFEEKLELKLLIDECQNLAGKMYNPYEINKIVYMYDSMGLSVEYILNTYNYCIGKNRTEIHFLEKTVFNLYNEGVDNDEKLREYLKRKEEAASLTGKLRRLLGMGTRAVTKTEEKIIDKWQSTFKLPYEMIEYSYELMIDSKVERPSLAYMDKILTSWVKAGYSTVEQAKEANYNYRAQKKTELKETETSFDNDEFFEAALKRSYDNIGKDPKNP